MQVGPIPSASSVALAARQELGSPAAAPAKPLPTNKPPFQPAPPIRPTVQDVIDFDRALLALRKFG